MRGVFMRLGSRVSSSKQSAILHFSPLSGFVVVDLGAEDYARWGQRQSDNNALYCPEDCDDKSLKEKVGWTKPDPAATTERKSIPVATNRHSSGTEQHLDMDEEGRRRSERNRTRQTAAAGPPRLPATVTTGTGSTSLGGSDDATTSLDGVAGQDSKRSDTDTVGRSSSPPPQPIELQTIAPPYSPRPANCRKCQNNDARYHYDSYQRSSRKDNSRDYDGGYRDKGRRRVIIRLHRKHIEHPPPTHLDVAPLLHTAPTLSYDSKIIPTTSQEGSDLLKRKTLRAATTKIINEIGVLLATYPADIGDLEEGSDVND
ncbi:hypothetical protein HPB47_003101 [Ixodes persulcatus]|uniref:Uncharacterized protein n=1 Tax=Ixodes persulcatus TaxID=34615 RepID=A0AC60PJT4_IXOPE|nr:hypothetical protein HPB47_003101 [Ixodes persulcatus]